MVKESLGNLQKKGQNKILKKSYTSGLLVILQEEKKLFCVEHITNVLSMLKVDKMSP